MLPYGFYLRAMFYNKDLFKQAGIDAPPRTMDEFAADAKTISALPGKSGYCLRGGPGGLNGWMMFGATMSGSDAFFSSDGTPRPSAIPTGSRARNSSSISTRAAALRRTASTGASNEIVAGFYSGTCAMLDQDPDALIAVAERMRPEQFGIATMPKGPSGRAYPTLGYAGWSIFANSANKALDWELVATLDGPEGNIAWNKRTGALPIYTSAENDPFYKGDQFKGWFAELADKGRGAAGDADLSSGLRLFRRFDRGEDRPAGASRADHARRPEQAMGGRAHQGQAEDEGRLRRLA